MHNLQIVNYGLGHLGSIHDTYAFQATQLACKHKLVLPAEHWVWANSAYPLEPWCLSPFKRPRGGSLFIYNWYLSKVHVQVEHAFVALKGRFQLLRELRLQIWSKQDLYVMIYFVPLWWLPQQYWVECCLILHNMIVHFEKGKQGEALMMDWALHEGLQFERQNEENVVVGEVSGSPGQCHCTGLMGDLLRVCSH
ncbi:hypothetical protein PISMIDRAFT_102728 [Pisolithus microcarpus 441]|uniref:DDE Tnp4 domain-containing protein n=1 Tax=Pisolithus microcarpus 441 TaxID=765257 RepID=A0A0C9YZP6_9AGAM|nr:hypothetical protein PISMIDRAFT_102728 [Pisolithus microcarpus 441]